MPELTNYGGLCARVFLWDKNSVGDTAVTVPSGGGKYWQVTAVREYNTSATQNGSSATLALYTAADAGGTAIVSAATATGLTAAAKHKDHTVASHDLQTGSTVYLRNTVAQGSALTVSVQIEFRAYG